METASSCKACEQLQSRVWAHPEPKRTCDIQVQGRGTCMLMAVPERSRGRYRCRSSLRRIHAVSLIALAVGGRWTPVEGACANFCSGHGDCDHFNRCSCWSGWGGADCSERLCPQGVAWSDEATGIDTAHNGAVCSNRGLCNRATGRCQCTTGFSGAACERSICPNECNDHGTCRSMEQYADQYRDPVTADQWNYTLPWDAGKVHGCVCDLGWSGYDCSVRQCPRGDDPLTTGQVNEVQQVVCQANGGTFVLYYGGEATPTISAAADSDTVAAALSSLSLIPSVDVSFSDATAGACDATVINVISVTFTQNFGPLQPMWGYSDDLIGGSTDPPIIVVANGSSVYDLNNVEYPSVKGTKENALCSNRGLCDTETGTCSCYVTNDDIFASSNGYNAPGTRGDCGYNVTVTAGCPGEIACSGHGNCNGTSLACDCEDGWTSGDCSLRTCPSGWSWFSYPSADSKAHDVFTECSDGGVCDRESGACKCGDMFTGAGCEYLVCPGAPLNPCSGHGQCMTMAELASVSNDNGDATGYTYGLDANLGLTWDADRVYGCHCDEGYGGFDCSEQTCPTGDDPMTWGANHEVQLVECIATNGSFTLSFRQAVTDPINFDANETDIQYALEALSTIGEVIVTFTNASESTVCTTDATNFANVTFLTEHGELPALIADYAALVDDNNGGALGSGLLTVYSGGAVAGSATVNYTSASGTTEEDACSNRGLCNRATGVCECFVGWTSSNGYGGLGDRGDCGYRIPVAAGVRVGNHLVIAGQDPASRTGRIEPEPRTGRISMNAQQAYRDMAAIDIADKM